MQPIQEEWLEDLQHFVKTFFLAEFRHRIRLRVTHYLDIGIYGN